MGCWRRVGGRRDGRRQRDRQLTITGTLAEINATLAAGNVTYTPAHDFFGTDTLTVRPATVGLTDTDAVSIHVNTLLTGTAGDDSFAAPARQCAHRCVRRR